MGSLLFLLFFGPFSGAVSQPWTIDSFIQKTQAESEVAKAAGKTIMSIEYEIRSRDLLLGFQLLGEAADVKDNRDQVTFARRTDYEFLTFQLRKPFATGTTLLLTGNHQDSLYDVLGRRASEAWEVRVTQSLWRDFFGRGTSLRHQGERAEMVSRKASAYFNLQSFLVNIENSYWDLAFSLKEAEVRLRNIENGKRLEQWTRRRAANSAAEKSDLFQAQALVSQATVEYLTAQNTAEKLKNTVRQFLPDLGDDPINIDYRSLETDRGLQTLVVNEPNGGDLRRLDTVSAVYLSEQAAAEAKRVKDSLRPQVDAYVAYGQNGIAPTVSEAWERSNSTDRSISTVGVVFSVDLNRGLVADRVRASQLAAEAQVLNSQAQNRLSAIGWEELVREVTLLKSKVQESARLAQLQLSKVAEERERFRLGRSTVFQLVTYELDAARAEIERYRALIELRKAESQARLFTNMGGA